MEQQFCLSAVYGTGMVVKVLPLSSVAPVCLTHQLPSPLLFPLDRHYG
jgi:hypothetical protein